MFWTAFTWGIGATLGGSIGLMAFVIMFSGWHWLVNTETAKQSIKFAESNLLALNNRNELTVEQIQSIDRIARAIERFNPPSFELK